MNLTSYETLTSWTSLTFSPFMAARITIRPLKDLYRLAVSLWGQTEFQGWEHCGVHCHQSVLWTGCLAQGYNRVSSFFPSWQKLPWLLKEAQKGPLLFYKEKTLQGPLHSSSSNLISMTFYARRLLLCMIWSCILNFPRLPLNQPPSSQRRFTKLTILAASHMKRK